MDNSGDGGDDEYCWELEVVLRGAGEAGGWMGGDGVMGVLGGDNNDGDHCDG